MRQKGFATIFGLCLIFVVALIVKGINDAETNHAREVINFETEQILQRAAESAIVEAAANLPYDQPKIIDAQRTFDNGRRSFQVHVEAWQEYGAIHVDGNGKDGFYIMSRATTDDDFFGEKIYRRAYAYILDGDTTIRFMELP